MSIEFKLVRSGQLLDPDQYTARVIARTASMEQLVDRIMQHGSSVCRSDVISVLEDLTMTLENMLLEGWTILTPLANFRLTLQGVFDGRGAEFDPEKHRVTAQIIAGRQLRRAIRERVQVARQVEQQPEPLVVDYLDVASGAVHSTLTPGGEGLVTGKLIKFDAADAEQGIFFVAADGTATRVTSVAWNGVTKHIFQVPALPAGEYALQVRASFNGNGDVRTGELLDRLTVS